MLITLRKLGGTAVALGLCAVASPVLAGVLEIRPDGTVATYEGPGVHRDGGRQPISVPATLAPVRATRAAPAPVSAAIDGAAGRYQLSADLIEAVAWQESRFRQAAVSPKGAVGVMQLMPATARGLGVDGRDLDQNVLGGAAYLTQMLNRYRGDVVLALAAYNAGPGAVDRYGGVPPYAETKTYVEAVLERMALIAAARQ